MLDPSTLFLILFSFFVYSQVYNKKYVLIDWSTLSNICFFIHSFNEVILDLDTEDKDLDTEGKELEKYEDKYLTDIRRMENNYIFNEQELEIIKEQKSAFLKMVDDTEKEIEELKSKLSLQQQNEFQICGKGYIMPQEEPAMNCIHSAKEEINERIKRMNDILKSKDTAEEKAINFVILQRMKHLEGCYVMEHTPQGNVLMIYDNVRNSFKYYSDNTIPYRYLEVVARKYVKMFDCRPIYVDMEEELQIAEEKWEKDYEEKEKEREKETSAGSADTHKKSVFAKFKSYNKEGGSGRVNSVAPPKNSIPSKMEVSKDKNRKVVLKNSANRYTYEGKFANFNFLKKVERKAVDKKYALSFADFKKLHNQ